MRVCCQVATLICEATVYHILAHYLLDHTRLRALKTCACPAAAAQPPPAAGTTSNPALDRRTCVLDKGSARQGHIAAVVVMACNRSDYLRLAMSSALEVHGQERANR